MHGTHDIRPERTFSIGDASAATGCKVETIRFYESIGLLPAPHRTSGNQRRYLARHVERLRLILHAREFGLPVDDIRELIAVLDEPQGSCEKAHEIARRQLRQIERKIATLHALAGQLRGLVDAGGEHSVAECRVLTTLADGSRHAHGEAQSGRAAGRD